MSKARSLLFRGINTLQTRGQPQLTILIYHQVLPEPDPLRPWEIDQTRFRQHLSWIAGTYKVIPLSEAVQKLANGTLEPGCACITFDDGYQNNATVASQILAEFNFHATFFCTSAYLDGDMMWNDKVIESVRYWPQSSLALAALDISPQPVDSIAQKQSAIQTILNKLKYAGFDERRQIANQLLQQSGAKPERLMMTSDEVLQLHRQGMAIGGHTHDHPILLKLQPEQAAQQILHNKNILQDITGEALTLFAYPNGKPGVDYNREHIDLIKQAGYQAAMSTSPGTANKTSDPFQLPRFTPWDRTANRFLTRLAMNLRTQPHLI